MSYKIYTQDEVDKIISECFEFGAGGFTSCDDREEYNKMAFNFIVKNDLGIEVEKI